MSYRTMTLGIFVALVLSAGAMMKPTTVFAAPNGVTPQGATAASGTTGSQAPVKAALHSPVRLALGPGGLLFVSDYRFQGIVMVNRNSLKVIQRFTFPGKPLGVAYADGRVYVGNETTSTVEIYNQGGRPMGILGNRGDVKSPTDIAVDLEADMIFVVDSEDKAVKIFSVDGELLSTIPETFPMPSVLGMPTGIAVDTERKEILVSDFGEGGWNAKPRIQIFNYDGVLVGTIWGKTGWFGAARFSRPQGLAVDGLGHVFMVDSLSGEVMVFDRDTGELLKTMGSYGAEPGQLNLGLDVVLEPTSNDLYVTNNLNSRIEVFTEGGVLP